MGIKVKNFLEENNIETVLDDTDENFSGKLKKFNLIGKKLLKIKFGSDFL